MGEDYMEKIWDYPLFLFIQAKLVLPLLWEKKSKVACIACGSLQLAFNKNLYVFFYS